MTFTVYRALSVLESALSTRADAGLSPRLRADAGIAAASPAMIEIDTLSRIMSADHNRV